MNKLENKKVSKGAGANSVAIANDNFENKVEVSKIEKKEGLIMNNFTDEMMTGVVDTGVIKNGEFVTKFLMMGMEPDKNGKPNFQFTFIGADNYKHVVCTGPEYLHSLMRNFGKQVGIDYVECTKEGFNRVLNAAKDKDITVYYVNGNKYLYKKETPVVVSEDAIAV